MCYMVSSTDLNWPQNQTQGKSQDHLIMAKFGTQERKQYNLRDPIWQAKTLVNKLTRSNKKRSEQTQGDCWNARTGDQENLAHEDEEHNLNTQDERRYQDTGDNEYRWFFDAFCNTVRHSATIYLDVEKEIRNK